MIVQTPRPEVGMEINVWIKHYGMCGPFAIEKMNRYSVVVVVDGKRRRFDRFSYRHWNRIENDVVVGQVPNIDNVVRGNSNEVRRQKDMDQAQADNRRVT